MTGDTFESNQRTEGWKAEILAVPIAPEGSGLILNQDGGKSPFIVDIPIKNCDFPCNS